MLNAQWAARSVLVNIAVQEPIGPDEGGDGVRPLDARVVVLDGPDVVNRSTVIDWLKRGTRHAEGGSTVRAVALERHAIALLDALEVDVPAGTIDVRVER